MAKLSVQEVKSFKIMLHELKENFLKKRAEAQGSRERMKTLADRCVQAYNEAEKRKALGRPGIDPKMAAKKKRRLFQLNQRHQGRKQFRLSSQLQRLARSQRAGQQL